jgi:hypothetical protein
VPDDPRRLPRHRDIDGRLASTRPANRCWSPGLDDIDQRQAVTACPSKTAVGDQPLGQLAPDHAGGTDDGDMHR